MPLAKIVDADEKRMMRHALRERRGAPVFAAMLLAPAVLHATAMAMAEIMKKRQMLQIMHDKDV